MPVLDGSNGLAKQLPYFVPTYDESISPYCVFAALINKEQSGLFIFAPNGQPLFYKTFDNFFYNFTIQPNGLLSYYDDDVEGFLLMDSLFNVVDTVKTIGFRTNYHELRITKDGSYLLFGDDPRSIDMSKIVEGGDQNATVIGMVVQKLDARKNLVFEWKSFDHFDVTDSYADLTSSYIDYAHFNAIATDTDSTIILSSRNLSELTRINLRTGDIIWRMGGKNNQFTFVGFDRMFSGQHDIRRMHGDTYSLFDNGVNGNPQYSKGIEFTIDEQAMTVKEVKEYRHDPDIYSTIMGGVQILENGNTLIDWGNNTFSEYDAGDHIVHEGKFLNCDFFTYRVGKFAWKNKSFSAGQENIEFGSQEVGDSVIRHVSIQNHSNDTLVINELNWRQSAFNVNQDSVIILPGGQSDLEIVFKPEKNGTLVDTLTLRSAKGNQGIAIQVSLNGTGVGGPDFTTPVKTNPVLFFPVPFNEYLQYRFEKPVDRIEIRDMKGRQVLTTNHAGLTGRMDTRRFPAWCLRCNCLLLRQIQNSGIDPEMKLFFV